MEIVFFICIALLLSVYGNFLAETDAKSLQIAALELAVAQLQEQASKQLDNNIDMLRSRGIYSAYFHSNN